MLLRFLNPGLQRKAGICLNNDERWLPPTKPTEAKQSAVTAICFEAPQRLGRNVGVTYSPFAFFAASRETDRIKARSHAKAAK